MYSKWPAKRQPVLGKGHRLRDTRPPHLGQPLTSKVSPCQKVLLCHTVLMNAKIIRRGEKRLPPGRDSSANRLRFLRAPGVASLTFVTPKRGDCHGVRLRSGAAGRSGSTPGLCSSDRGEEEEAAGLS